MKQIKPMRMLLNVRSVLLVHGQMNVFEIGMKLEDRGITVTNFPRLSKLIKSEAARYFDIYAEGTNFFVRPDVVAYSRRRNTEPKVESVQEIRQLVTSGRRAGKTTRATQAQMLDFCEKNDRWPMQKYPEETKLYQAFLEQRKMDPRFAEKVERYRGKKGSKTGPRGVNRVGMEDVNLAMQLAESGGTGFA